jgi:hypothetical protein
MARLVHPSADLQGLFGPAWAALRARHPDVPGVSFAPMPDDGPERGFGAVAIPGRHQDGTSYAQLTVLVAPGWLYSAENQAFLILAHEAAHALDYARHREVSGHGEVFAALARDLGLTAEKRTDPPRFGDYEPALTDSIRADYAETIEALGVALEELGAVNCVV